MAAQVKLRGRPSPSLSRNCASGASGSSASLRPDELSDSDDELKERSFLGGLPFSSALGLDDADGDEICNDEESGSEGAPAVSAYSDRDGLSDQDSDDRKV